MNIKKKHVRQVLDALKPLKLQKISDTKFRKTIVNNYVALSMAWNKIQEEEKALREAHLGALEEEQDEVVKLQQELQLERNVEKQLEILRSINKKKAVLDAMRNFGKDVAEYENQEIEIAGIPQDKLIEAVQAQDFDLGVIEVLMPVFCN